jgi:hypothetical protein
MRVSCSDKNLIDHFENNKLNAFYLSPLVQNNFIEICGKITQEQIVEKINKSKFFSVLVDETTDLKLALNSYHYVCGIWSKE